MINNPSSLCRMTPPPLVPHPKDKIYLSQYITVQVLDSNNEPTGELKTISIVKEVEVPDMLIDQSLSANDLTISKCLEYGIPLGEPVSGYSLNSESPESLVNELNNIVSENKSRFVEPSTPSSTEPSVEPSN